MKSAAERGSGCFVFLYLAALPVYLVRFAATALRLFRFSRISRLGYVDCPHCDTENALDVLSTCPRCKTIEYGNRLRCTGCGFQGISFPCDACGVTIHCL